MKKLLLSFFVLFNVFCFAQGSKPDLANLKSRDDISLDIKGLSLENTISQEKIVTLKEWGLKGENATKFKIAYYQLKTNYNHTFSKNDEFFSNEVTPVMTQFFTDLEKNCKLMFEDVVIREIETGKQFKIAPLTVIIKTE
jgi:hypothetical protein